MDCQARFGLDDVQPTLARASEYVVSKCSKNGDTSRLLCILRCLFLVLRLLRLSATWSSWELALTRNGLIDVN